MVKLIGQLKEVVSELRLAIKEVRELLAAVDSALVTPNMATIAAVKSELSDVLKSIRTKGI